MPAITHVFTRASSLLLEFPELPDLKHWTSWWNGPGREAYLSHVGRQ